LDVIAGGWLSSNFLKLINVGCTPEVRIFRLAILLNYQEGILVGNGVVLKLAE
jgi:hypothetical protein